MHIQTSFSRDVLQRHRGTMHACTQGATLLLTERVLQINQSVAERPGRLRQGMAR